MGYHPEVSRTDAARNRAGQQRQVPERRACQRRGRLRAGLVPVRQPRRTSRHQAQARRPLRHLHTGGPPASSPARSTAVRASRAALEGALDQIAHLGGGLVEAISEVTAGRQAQGRFLFSATVELFEQNGFTRVRQVGNHAWIVSKVIQPA